MSVSQKRRDVKTAEYRIEIHRRAEWRGEHREEDRDVQEQLPELRQEQTRLLETV